MTRKNNIQPFLVHESKKIRDQLYRLKPRRQTRSLNFIGSAWKWIAGNPDHDDFEIIEDKINNALRNNNKQVIINKVTIQRINEITKVTNNLIELLKINNNSLIDLATNLKYKLEIIKEEVTNVEYAVQWAKAGLINSFILSNTEINITKEIFERSKIPYVNLDEALEFAAAKIASNDTTLIYIVSIPTTKVETCKVNLIKAVKRKEIINKIHFEKVLICEKTIYGIKKECKTVNDLTICNDKQILDISNDNCIYNLLKSKIPACMKINNRHLPNVEEISPGILFLNQFNNTISVNNDKLKLFGSFVIKYHNLTIEIDNKKYINKEISTSNPLPAIVQPNSLINNYEELLTLEMMKELHVNNTENIKLIENQNSKSFITNISLSTIAFILIILLTIKIFAPKFRKTIKLNVSEAPKEEIPKEEIPLHEILPKVIEEPSFQKPLKINQIPFF